MREFNTRSTEQSGFGRDLADSIRMSASPKSSTPVQAPLAQGVVNGLLNAAPSLFAAINGDQRFKMIGPPEALSSTLSNMLDKQGNVLGGFVDESGKLAGQKRFEDVSGALNGAAAAAAVFQVLSVVTARN